MNMMLISIKLIKNFKNRAVSVYKTNNYHIYENRVKFVDGYFFKKNVIIDDDDDDDDDEKIENKIENEIENKPIQYAIKYESSKNNNIKKKVCNLKHIIERDVNMINEIVEDVECKYSIYNEKEKDNEKDKEKAKEKVDVDDNCLIICFLIKPERLFKNKRDVFWKEIDFKRQICLLLNYVYDDSIDSGKDVEDNKHADKDVTYLNVKPSISLFQTKDNIDNVLLY